MAIEMIFKGEDEDPNQLTIGISLNRIDIMIYDPTSKSQENMMDILLDKETAIKLAKELRKQISFLED